MTALRRPAAAAAGIGIVLIFAWWQLLMKPQSAALADAHHRSAQASTALFQTGQRLGHLKHLATNSAQLVALDQRLRAAIPPGDDLDQFLLSLNAMAQTSNVAVRSLTPSAQAPTSGGLSSMALRMTVEGGYFDVQRFLDALKSGERLVLVDALSEAPIGGQASTGSKVSAQITAHLLSGMTTTVKIPAAVPAQPTPPAGGKH